jgi:type II secretory pathway component PulC
MMRTHEGASVFFLALLMALFAAPAVGQQPPANQPAAQQAGKANEEVDLSYRREVFTYPERGRRDPFLPLTSATGVGPRFEELALQGIMYSPVRGKSVALLAAGNRIFTVHSGDVVGNARVVEIDPTRVVFAVNNFGTVRQQMLELKRKEGAGG